MPPALRSQHESPFLDGKCKIFSIFCAKKFASFVHPIIPPGIGRKIAVNVSRWRREQLQRPPAAASPGAIIHSIEEDEDDDAWDGYKYGDDIDLDDLTAEEDSQLTRYGGI